MRLHRKEPVSPFSCFCLYPQKNRENALFMFWRESGVSLKGRISHLPEQPCWLYSKIALQQHSPVLIFFPSEDWLSSRCLTSVIKREQTSAADGENAYYGMPFFQLFSGRLKAKTGSAGPTRQDRLKSALSEIISLKQMCVFLWYR